VPVLIERLGRGQSWKREAAEALGQIGTPAKSALPALAGLLESRDYQARIAAAEAIRLIGGDIAPTIPALVECLGVERIEYGNFSEFPGRLEAAQIRARATRALGQLGRGATESTAALENLLDDELITVREAAGEALHSIEAESAN
jgi:hypothetical protein